MKKRWKKLISNNVDSLVSKGGTIPRGKHNSTNPSWRQKIIVVHPIQQLQS